MKEESIVSIIVALIGAITAIIVRLIEKNRSDKRGRKLVAPPKKMDKKTLIYRILFFISILIAICGTGSLIKLSLFPSKPEICKR
jgi:membrane protein CcdC involved in cytochrome C biogenesis